LRETRLATIAALACLAITFALPAPADDPRAVLSSESAVKAAVKAPGYSPYAGRSFPTQVSFLNTPSAA
jgi:hypothetical protein